MTREELNALIDEIDHKNAEYIRNDSRVLDQWDSLCRLKKNIETDNFNDIGESNFYMTHGADILRSRYERLCDEIRSFDERRLVPTNVEVGQGASVHYWSDRVACTIIKVTKTTITLQRDKATLDPNFKPEWVSGGFCGHCINQDEQTYTYERDPNGQTYTFHWSKKWQMYGQPDDLRAFKGRHEFYDYNF